MKKTLSVYFILLATFCQAQSITSIISSVNTQRKSRGIGVVLPPLPSGNVFSVFFDTTDNATISDLRSALSSYTTGGKTVTISKVPLELRTGQAYYINATTTSVQINYTNPLSLENAVYGYMSMLGINYYGSGDNWFYKPEIVNQPIISGWQEPAFRNRGFFGTGAIDLPQNIAFDSTNEFRTKWYRWKKRTRWNQDFIDRGHTGEAFYQANKTLLDANPHWFNSALGRINGRIKIENDSATAAYKSWVIASDYNPNNLFNNIGTDPEDGRGGPNDPLPPNGFQGINNWNHADKWWWLTNEVAKMFDENDTRTVVSALAYGDGPFNALAPKFSLRKNVLPMVTPYAFQTAYLPREMVKVWADTIDGKMSIYDYWNITQYSLGSPQFNMQTMVEKLKFWHENKINGVALETTDGGGPMGHIFWISSHLNWNPYLSFDSLYTKYLTDCFGAAAPEMRKMYNRWSNNYQEAAESDFSLINLKNASDLVTVNSKEWLRINELKGYVHFMKLMAEHDNSLESMNEIFYWLYRIHHLRMVQTAAFMDQWYIQPFNMRPAPIYDPISTAQLHTQFLQDYDSIKVNYTVSDFVFNYDRVSYTVPIPNEAWRFGTSANFTFKATFTGVVSITVGAQGNTRFKVSDDSSVLLSDTVGIDKFDFTESLPDQPLWYEKNYNFNIVAGQFYTINTRAGFNRVKVNTPGIVLFTRAGQEDFDNFAYPSKYFYVPTGTTEIVFSSSTPEAPAGSAISPSGVTLFRTYAGAKDTYKVTVPAGDDGKVWSLAFGSPYWQLRNLPNYFALQPFSYNEAP